MKGINGFCYVFIFSCSLRCLSFPWVAFFSPQPILLFRYLSVLLGTFLHCLVMLVSLKALYVEVRLDGI